MKGSAHILRAAVFFLFAAGLVWFLIPLRWRAGSAGTAAGIVFCFAAMLVCLFFTKIRAACAKSRAVRRTMCAAAVFCGAAVVWAAAMTVCMATAAATAPPENATVVVLGSLVSGSSPSADLWSRICAAADYLKKHPQAKCVASGGRGARENLTEASVIRDCLIRDGIDPSRIFAEEQSANTKENFAYSLRIIGRKGLSRDLAVVTDEYHEFRACSIARSLGANPYAVPAHTPWYIFSACWSREVLALTKYLLIPG